MKLEELFKIIKKRRAEKPDGSYITSLIEQGKDSVIQKVGEETIELVIAAKNSDKKRIISESADLLFHLLILLEQCGISLDDIYGELESRKK